MKFKIKRLDRNKHIDIVSCVGWTSGGELFSVSDDYTMLKWDINGEPESKVMDIDVPVMDMDWLPSGKGANEVLALACSDGSFKLVSKAGRVEKNITEAHASAIISIKWSYDGAAIATSGEDGQIKIWSRVACSDPLLYKVENLFMQLSGPQRTIHFSMHATKI
jgi:intraflagellar transport protein 80